MVVWINNPSLLLLNDPRSRSAREVRGQSSGGPAANQDPRRPTGIGRAACLTGHGPRLRLREIPESLEKMDTGVSAGPRNLD